jgi:phospholipid transport system substrate-binding protein
MKNGFLTATLLILFLFWTVPVHSKTELKSQPGKLIEEKTSQVLTLISDTEYYRADRYDTLKQKLRVIIEPVFAFEEMTLRSLGSHARGIEKEQLDELVKLYKTLLENMYVDRFTRSLVENPGDTFIPKVTMTGEELKGNYAQISTEARVDNDGEKMKFKINYRLVKRSEDWKIYDLVIEENSLIQNYRSQFNEILTNHPVEELIKLLREKIENFQDEPGKIQKDGTIVPLTEKKE